MSVRVYNSLLQDLSLLDFNDRHVTQLSSKKMEDESPYCALISFMEDKSLVNKRKRSNSESSSVALEDFAIDAQTFKRSRQLLALDLLGPENVDDNLSVDSDDSENSHSSDIDALTGISSFLSEQFNSASFLEDLFTMENERLEA